MSDSPLPPPSGRVINFEKSPLHRTMFSNFFRYLPTLSDFTFTFSRIVGARPGDPAAVVVDEGEVTVTYTQLKIMHEHISLFLRVYERELGLIEVPPTQMPEAADVERHVQNLKTLWGRT
jgi:hypothetical protein